MNELSTQTAEKAPIKAVKANPHKGHRERMRQKFRSSDFDSISPHEILEFLLFYAQPQRNTNETAHALIETFGSLPGVLNASYNELKRVDDLGDAAATLLCLLPKIFRRYSKDQLDIADAFDTLSKLKHYCRSLFIGATVEQVYMLLFDNGMHILDCTLLAHGTVNSVCVITRQIAEKALEKHASFVVITHNHPNGLPLPSEEDISMTETIEEALKLFQIPLLEHILVSQAECVPLIYDRRGINREAVSENPPSDGFLRAFYGLEEA